MNSQYYEKIADLMLFCIDLKQDEKLHVGLNHDCREAVKPLVYKAYERGASWVGLRYIDDFVNAAAIKAGRTALDFPENYRLGLRETCEPGWKTVNYMSFTEGDVYEDLPGDDSAAFFRNYQEVVKYRRQKTLSSAFAWTLTFIPTVESAEKVFPGLSGNQALEAYWKEVVRIMRLDLDDPVGFWREKFEKDAKRSEYLDEIAPEYLDFKGPGTDLRVGLNSNACWMGGMKTAQTGDLFAANLPTDEIFTSPDFRLTEGRVRLTRPFVMHQNLGSIPVNAWFEFREGRVVDYGADEGKNSLDMLFARDERAKYIGEIALVDPHSPFAESGLTFYNGLYDENAACHLALGAAYSGTLRTPGEYSDQQLLEMGMNTSSVHEDMMIGSKEVDVTAVCSGGRRVDIIKDGIFLI